MPTVTVVGAGLAGLIAATTLAKRGIAVRCLESNPSPGGRARTQVRDGYAFNLGPRALYTDGPLHRALLDLGVPVRGAAPAASGVVWCDNTSSLLPSTPLGLLRTSILTWADKIAFVTLLRAMPPHLQQESAAAWLERCVPRARVRAAVEMFLRLVTYTADMERLDMAIARGALLAGTQTGVLYLHGGWQPLVDNLRACAIAAGVDLQLGTRVESLTGLDGPILLAVSPNAVRKLVPGWEHPTTPVQAACLDIALARVPEPGSKLALGVDPPLYAALHSATARLAPEGGGVLHVLQYLKPGDIADRAALERFADNLQPGWRDVAVRVRYVPHVTVTYDHPTHGRAPMRATDNIWLAGDWVGPIAALGDCAATTALAAADTIAQALRRKAA